MMTTEVKRYVEMPASPEEPSGQRNNGHGLSLTDIVKMHFLIAVEQLNPVSSDRPVCLKGPPTPSVIASHIERHSMKILWQGVSEYGQFKRDHARKISQRQFCPMTPSNQMVSHVEPILVYKDLTSDLVELLPGHIGFEIQPDHAMHILQFCVR